MEYYISRTTETSKILKLHQKLFPLDDFPTEDSNSSYWLCYHEDKPIGFAIGRMIPKDKTLFLSRAGVLDGHSGNGIHRRFINCRERFARKQGCSHVVTYVVHNNPKSMVNLVKRKYTIYEPAQNWAGKDVTYFLKTL